MPDIETIPTYQLQVDLISSTHDIWLCELALSVGVNVYGDNFDVRKRLEDNKKIVSIIETELERRTQSDKMDASRECIDVFTKKGKRND